MRPFARYVFIFLLFFSVFMLGVWVGRGTAFKEF